MLSQSMCISHHQDVHFKYLKSFFVNYTSAKLEGKKRKESPEEETDLSKVCQRILTESWPQISCLPSRIVVFKPKGKLQGPLIFGVLIGHREGWALSPESYGDSALVFLLFVFLSLFFLFLNWSILCLQCCVNFSYTAKWFIICIYIVNIYMYIYIYFFRFFSIVVYYKILNIGCWHWPWLGLFSTTDSPRGGWCDGMWTHCLPPLIQFSSSVSGDRAPVCQVPHRMLKSRKERASPHPLGTVSPGGHRDPYWIPAMEWWKSGGAQFRLDTASGRT